MKPKINASNKFTTHQRHSELNQQVAKSVRPQLPRDGSKDGRPYWTPGELPKGGYQSTWCFGDSHDTKKSPTQVKEKKVY